MQKCILCNSCVLNELKCTAIYTTVSLSYSMIVLYSKDHKGVGMAHVKTSPKSQPQFSLTTMRQYWLGKTKPKQAFRSTRNAFNKLL